MIKRNRSDHGDEGHDCIRRIEPSAHPGLQNDEFAARFGKMPQSEGSGQFKERRRMRPIGGELTKNLQSAPDCLLRNLPAINPNALAKVDEMRRSVEPGSASPGAEDRIQHRANRSLAVRARYVQKGEAFLRIAQAPKQASNIVEPKLDAELLCRIKPGERLFVGHFRNGDR